MLSRIHRFSPPPSVQVQCPGSTGSYHRAGDFTADVSIASNKFLWGATVTAHAVEGRDFDSDWWRWEQRPKHTSGDATAEIAADHLSRYGEDLGLAQKIGLNALQYGLSWARIEPHPGQYDEDALAHYASVFQSMAKKGITPIAVLQEHSLPAWFAERGAWSNPDAPRLFKAYVERVYDAIAGHCRHWIPLLEPALWLRMAYGEQRWPRPAGPARLLPPGSDPFRRIQSTIWEFLQEKDGANEVGLSVIAPALRPADPHSPWDRRAIQWQERLQAWRPAAARRRDVAGAPPCTFFALSFHGSRHIHFTPLQPRNHFAQYEIQPGLPASAADTASGAGVLEAVLETWGRHDVPLLVTGVGLPTEQDPDRCRHVLDHVHALLEARSAGVPLLGFCYRSLLDGFEWHHGFSKRFGLIHVNRNSLARTPNPSAFLYQDIARYNAIRPGAVTRYCPGWQAPMREAS